MENKPIIDSWAQFGVRIIGKLYNDDRTQNGNEILTSSIKSIDREKGILETQNTVYDLGREIV